MDWEPSPGAAVSNGGWTRRPPSTWDADDLEPDLPTTSDWDSFAVNKQRIFAEPHTEDTGLESLLAGWGLDGVATSDGTSSMVAPSAMRQRQGMIVDERFLRAVSWCLFAARCIGAIALTIGHIETKIIGDVLSANRTMLFAELGATSVQLVLLWTIPNNRSPQSSFVRNGIQIISILARCTALIRPVAVDNFVQAIRWSDRRIPVEWAAWAVLDLVSCCI